MNRTSLLLEIVDAANGNNSSHCPFEEVVPKGVELFAVPAEVHRLLVIWQRLEREAAGKLNVPSPREDRQWMWFKDEANAVLLIATRHVQTTYHRTRAHEVKFYRNWQCSFHLLST